MHEIRTKVRGVTHRNTDGSSRQSIIRECQAGEQLQLVHDPENEFDSNAVKICRADGSQVGYLSAELAADFAPLLQNAIPDVAFIAHITGGTPEKPTLGVNITVQLDASYDSSGVASTYSNDDLQPLPPARAYDRYLRDALEDGKLNSHELDRCKEMQKPLGHSKVKAIHARRYAAWLDEASIDGHISQEDEGRLMNIRIFLDSLGWCP